MTDSLNKLLAMLLLGPPRRKSKRWGKYGPNRDLSKFGSASDLKEET